MKKITILTVVMLCSLYGLRAQTTDTVKVVNFSYEPSDLTINVGDTVKFEGNDSHPLVQVSQETWDANGNTPLSGGFAFSSGSGEVGFKDAGTYYYVCTAHVASNGMKGKITVVMPAALHELSDAGIASIYPLPLTGNELTVSFKNPVQKHLEVYIYDIAGNLRISTTGSTTDGLYKVDCATLPKGLFLMKLKADGEYHSARIVRQ